MLYGVNELVIALAAIDLLQLTIEVGYRVGGRRIEVVGFGTPPDTLSITSSSASDVRMLLWIPGNEA